MGRSISASPAPIYSNSLNILANEYLAANDLVEMDAITGKASRVRVTDYAAVPTMNYGTAQTTTATGMILAQTEVINTQTLAYSRQAVVQSSDGSIFTLTNNSGVQVQGVKLNKYSPVGALLGTVIVDGTGATYHNYHLLLLSNGNLACVAQTLSSLYYAIYDQNLSVIRAGGNAADFAANALYYFSAVALSGGGFAIVYQQDTNLLLTRLMTFDNAGTQVLAPTTIWTRTGTAGTQYHKMAQLSDGNLAIAVVCSAGTGSIGLNHGVVTTGGATVLAFNNKTTAGNSTFPELSVLPGYYCFSHANGTNQVAYVCNNAGIVQGAGFTAATTSGNASNKTKVVNDGTTFYLLWHRSSDTGAMLTSLPTTGTGYVDAMLSTALYDYYLDAFCENGAIICATMRGGTTVSPQLYVARISTMALVSTSGTLFGVNSNVTNGQYHRLIPGGDCSFICLYDYASAAKTNLCVGKYANTAIIGVANANANAAALCNVSQNAGAYSCNPIIGSLTKAFDMSATSTLYGNKGTVLNNGVVLKGI